MCSCRCARARSSIAWCAAEDGEIELEMDDELFVTDEQIAAEEEEEPDMMKHAQYWDNFLALVDLCNEPWAAPEDDTDDYRKMRAVKAFNAGARFTPRSQPPHRAAQPPPHCLQVTKFRTI